MHQSAVRQRAEPNQQHIGVVFCRESLQPRIAKRIDPTLLIRKSENYAEILRLTSQHDAITHDLC